MKIIQIIAGQGGQNCGVYDYTEKLCQALENSGQDVVMEAFPSWSFCDLGRLQLVHGRRRDTVLHLQYPSMGIGSSLAPIALPAVPVGRYVATLHEFSVFHPVRRAAFLSWALFGSAIVFSNEYERGRFLAMYPFARSRCHVIPIGTNIDRACVAVSQRAPAGTLHGTSEAGRGAAVVFFGQVSPGKGVEEFLRTAAILRQRAPDLHLQLMGRMMRPASSFARHVRATCAEHGIELLEGLPAAQVSAQLRRADVAVLPFPDGISDKRGSALACLANGLTLVTIHSDRTPGWLRQTTYEMSAPEDAATTVCELLSGERELNPNRAALETGLQERTWGAIADRYGCLYAEL